MINNQKSGFLKRGIMWKIMFPSVLLITVTIVILATISGNRARDAIKEETLEKLKNTSSSIRIQFEDWLNSKRLDARGWAGLETSQMVLKKPEETKARARLCKTFRNLVKLYPYYQSVNLLNSNGDVVASSDKKKVGNLNLKDRDYFKQALSGKSVISDVLVSRATGLPFFTVAVPVKTDGIITGVIYAPIDLETFIKIYIDTQKTSDGGYASVLNSKGEYIAHPDRKTILNKEKSPGLQSWAGKVIGKKAGITSFKSESKRYYAGFETLDETGWVILVQRPEGVITAKSNSIRNITFLLGVISILFLSILLFFLIKPFVAGIKQVTDGLRNISSGDGDLTAKLKTEDKNEIGELVLYFNTFLEKLRGNISNVGEVVGRLNELSGKLDGISGKLNVATVEMTDRSQTVKVESTHMSDEVRLLMEVSRKMSSQIENIASATEEISQTVTSISSSSSEMSNTITVLAAAMEEMTASFTEVSSNCNNAASASNECSIMSRDAMDEIKRLGKVADGISKIISLIGDIADQTNLLALNANIEAASAGDAGRGFAVVANEIKELAKQTANATGEITDEIGVIQDRTKESINKITKMDKLITEINSMSNSIAAAVEEQTVTASEIAMSIAGGSRNVEAISRQISEISEAINIISSDIQGLNSSNNEKLVKYLDSAQRAVSAVGEQIGALSENVSRTKNQTEEMTSESSRVTSMSTELSSVVGSFRY
ncbi:HAMP domain-containing protein [Myxococcota bacterium]|nr:HAMP domain-containing protein [Myxococcota bacterium]MBU1380022.1 HAMP domain-containing protein [Myxococcota bacterium]MBU1496144.1 HAMP domain-containing protein [Myxococcota bacterium]